MTPHDDGSPLDPAQPTRCTPGSEGKILVLIARARLRLPLFHPQDNQAPPVLHAPGIAGGMATGRAAASAFRGVTYHARSGRWRARLTLDGRRVHLGVFGTAEEAAAAITAARKAARDAQ